MTEVNKIFITGGAGYVGSYLVPFLLEKGYQITVYDLMLYGSSFFKKHKNLNLINGDIRNQENLKKNIKGNDAVIHLACISNDPSFELNPALGKEINLDAFEPLVKISKDNGIKRFIYASSSSVYGIKKEKDVYEEMILEPLTDYSKFKADCENILLKHSSENFSGVTIRPATVCGYALRQRLDLSVNILTNLAYNQRKIKVFGGNQLRPNIHIKDMAEVYLKTLQSPKEKISGKIFNAGYENQSIINIAKIVKSVVGEDVSISIVETNDNRSYHISSQKIKNELDFVAKNTIKDAVIDLCNAFKKNILQDPLNNEFYFNIKRMKSINLK